MKPFVLPLSDPQADLATVGGKGMSLAKLVRAGLPVPDGFHVTTEAYRQFVEANGLQLHILKALENVNPALPSTLETASVSIGKLFGEAEIPANMVIAIVEAYKALPGDNPPVAVRSSATAEDLPEASFAGQQETFLNINGTEAVLDAVCKCWASLWTGRAIAYRLRQGIQPECVALAVVIQLLVPAEASGILFTANPLTGIRNESVINAAWGLGEAIVGGLVTPDTITVDKNTGRVIHRETSAKQVMTVRTETSTKEQPVPDSLKNKAVISDKQAAELSQLGSQIERLYSMAMDIEWTLVNKKFAIVQARPITALPLAPIAWIPPVPKSVFVRTSVVDLMPEPLRPLFVTLGIPTLRDQLRPIGKRIIGSEPDLGENYYTTINTYAYMCSSFPARGWVWLLTRLLPAYPRLMVGMVPIWRDEMRPQYNSLVAGLKDKVVADMSAVELWQTSQEILDAAMYYVCALMFATMGASAGSEMLLTRVYEKMARQEGDPPASTLLMGWDNIPAKAEKSLYDMAMWCGERTSLAKYLLSTDTERVAAQLKGSLPAEGVEEQDWIELMSRFAQHLDQFGHIIYQLDFAEDLPLDHPKPMLENMKMYLRAEGVNPHERQKTSEANRIQTAEKVLARLKGFRRWAFSKILKISQTLAEVREDALSEIGLGYPKLREMLRELGGRFVEKGVIEKAEDIFWLEKMEIDDLVAGYHRNRIVQVDERKTDWARYKAETPPPMIPMKKRVMGFKAETILAQSEDSHTDHTLKGVATSPGIVTAPACILHGPEDFDHMRHGDVLVAGTTTPAWTPLFAMASAVVTDIGGPLSHGSIVAREYSIPAVMGTGIATRRIHDGDMITVDGGAGTVTIAV